VWHSEPEPIKPKDQEFTINVFHVITMQSLTGKYRGLKGNPCDENRDLVKRTGVFWNENRFFPVRIDLQGVPCKPYRVWVCSAPKYC
jgi:hypothetical protein